MFSFPLALSGWIKISLCISVVRKCQTHKGTTYSMIASLLLWEHPLCAFYYYSQIVTVDWLIVTWRETVPGAIVRQLGSLLYDTSTWHQIECSNTHVHTKTHTHTYAHTRCIKLAQHHLQSIIWIRYWRCLGCRQALNKWNVKSKEK